MKNILIPLLCLAICACSNDDDDTSSKICNTADPLEDLSWLNDIKKTFEADLIPAGNQIIKYRYKEQDVFWIDSCVNCEDALIQIYNCTGAIICQKGGIAGLDDCPDFQSEATAMVILFNNVQN